MNARLHRLFPLFKKAGIDALLVSSWPNVSYLSGFKGTESWVLVSPKGRAFITDSRYVQQAMDEASGFTVYLRDMADFAAMNAVYARFFPGVPPARSTVAVAGLPRDARVEIDALARVP